MDGYTNSSRYTHDTSKNRIAINDKTNFVVINEHWFDYHSVCMCKHESSSRSRTPDFRPFPCTDGLPSKDGNFP